MSGVSGVILLPLNHRLLDANWLANRDLRIFDFDSDAGNICLSHQGVPVQRLFQLLCEF